jgi:alcohol-forming fatty acyl-CoA reductase
VTFINLNFIIIQKVFNFDIKDLNWHSYIEQYCLGIKKFVLNEDLSKMNNCRKDLER